MTDKQAIINNIESRTPAELAAFVLDGSISYAELCTLGGECFTGGMRTAVRRALADSREEVWQNACLDFTRPALESFLMVYPDGPHADEARELLAQIAADEAAQAAEQAWHTVDHNSEEALRNYIGDYPGTSQATEAEKILEAIAKDRLLNAGPDKLAAKVAEISQDRHIAEKAEAVAAMITERIARGLITKAELLDLISKDKNFMSARALYLLIEKYRRLGYEDLMNIGIDRRFVQFLAADSSPVALPAPPAPPTVDKVSAEVYFWGIPASGKTCALGAILSVANTDRVAKGMIKDNSCQGYGYMQHLSEMFRDEERVGLLPEGTATTNTYAMSFDLVDKDERIHPITCIDLAGELVECMSRKDARQPLSAMQEQALNTLTDLLVANRSKNRKIHIFVLEYGGENRLYGGLSQSTLLDGALRYIESTGIFARDTDAVYLMFTKVDRAGVTGDALVETLRQYTERHYSGFYNGLTRICKDNEINGGVVERIPFTMGEVCFQDFCLFRGSAAALVVKELLRRSKSFKAGKLGKLNNILSK